MTQRPLGELEAIIGYTFDDATLLQTALTHSSFVNENKSKDLLLTSNERLEYLGDAVLEFVISCELFDAFPDCDEGYLTQFRQQLVKEETLARVARGISLSDFLLVGKGLIGDRDRPSILCDALEALFAAVYLDSRDRQPDAAREVILRLMRLEIETGRLLRGGDYKTRMLQLVQGDGEDVLSYETVREDGPPHDRIFEVVARLNNSNIVGHGIGKTKREAEQNAAKEALILFGING